MGVHRQLFAAYAASFLIAATAGTLAVIALQETAGSEAELAAQYTDELLQMERVRYQAERVIASTRGYLMLRDADHLARVAAAAADLDARLDELGRAPLSSASASDLDAITFAAHEYTSLARGVAADDSPDLARDAETLLRPERNTLQQHLDTLAHRERASFGDALAAARTNASRTGLLVGLVAGFGLAVSALLAAAMSRRLARQHVALQRAIEEVRAHAAARQEVLAVVSHDLRGPLGTIVMGSDVLGQRLAATVGPDDRRSLHLIRSAADRMTYLVEQILDAERLDAGTLKLAVEDCDAAAVVQAAVEQFAFAAAQKSVVLEAHVPDESVHARIDRERVQQVLANLIGNALKFTPRSGRVVVTARDSGSDIELEVEDSGPGIPAEQIDHLFERYWQGASRTSHASIGVGLGLYICKQLVDAHGGAIWVESVLGAGSRFHVRLPRAPGTPSPPRREPVLLRDDESSS